MKATNWDKIKPGTLLIIDWEDIISDSGWVKDIAAQVYPPTVCKDMGWFINDDKLNIRITTSVNNCGDKNVTVIPKGVIRNVRVVRYKK